MANITNSFSTEKATDYVALSQLAYAMLAQNASEDWIIVNDYQAAEWFAKIPERS
ncbi:MAG: hypothetical protein A4E62_02806 [Syntrophorhabdus sp. PtaU1.Bin002]|jgi:hypothetical protein|nr:MAG: hypothetical protein A4E62_02806 [Syntrophorhabdus sp. PtaU1.Bin002]